VKIEYLTPSLEDEVMRRRRRRILSPFSLFILLYAFPLWRVGMRDNLDLERNFI